MAMSNLAENQVGTLARLVENQDYAVEILQAQVMGLKIRNLQLQMQVDPATAEEHF